MGCKIKIRRQGKEGGKENKQWFENKIERWI